MKKCPNCGAQVADDSRFCTECGKEFPQGNVCPHCGASVNEGDAFCQNCGKKLQDVVIPEYADVEESTDEEDNGNPRKKYVPLIIALCVVALLLGGAWWWKGSTSKVAMEDVVVDSANVVTDSANIAEKSQEEQIREQLQAICDYLINASDDEVIDKYFSAEFKKLYNDVVRYDSKYNNEIGFETYICSPGQDGHYTKAEVKQIDIKNETKATVDVLFTISCEGVISKSNESFSLLLENGKWVIDDYQNYKKVFRDYIREDGEASFADNVTPDTSIIAE